MENSSYPRIKNAVLLCLLLLGIQIVMGGILGFIIGILGYGIKSMLFGIGTIAAQLVSFCAVILIGYKKTHKTFQEVFRFNRVSFDYWLAAIVFMFGFVIVSSEIDNLLEIVLPMPQFMQDTFEIIIVKQAFAVSLLLVGIIPAFTEEMLFRGLLLNGFKDNYSEKKAILVTALLFGLVHLNPWQFVTAFIIGVFAAWLCLKTKSIVLCVYIHLFNNLVSVVSLNLSEIAPVRGFNAAAFDADRAAGPAFQPLWFDLTGIVLTALGVLLLVRSVRKGTLNEKA